VTQQASIEIIIILAFIALAFSILYALLMYRLPISPSFSWLPVSAGCAGILAAIALAQWHLTHDFWLTAIPSGFFILTGLPQILAMLIKDRQNLLEALHFIQEGDDD